MSRNLWRRLFEGLPGISLRLREAALCSYLTASQLRFRIPGGLPLRGSLGLGDLALFPTSGRFGHRRCFCAASCLHALGRGGLRGLLGLAHALFDA
jgi:hypothetical protein